MALWFCLKEMKTKKKILWKPQPKQALALKQRHFEILYGGARFGGKTECGLAWLLYDRMHPKYRALVTRRNSDDLKDWIDRAREMYFKFANAEVVGIPPEIRFPSGAKIRTGHLKDENAYTKYQGHEYHRILIEELTQIPRQEDYLKLIASCRSSTPDLKPQVFATTNPGGIGHEWVKQRWNLHGIPTKPIETIDAITGRNRVFIPARIDDNPIGMQNDPSYARFLDGLDPVLRKAWKEGDWDIFAGQFFHKWNEIMHIREPFDIPETWKKFRTYDYGYEAPACCLWFALDFDARAWVYREYYLPEGHKKDADIQAKDIKRLSGDEKYEYSIADPSIFSPTGLIDRMGGQTIAETFANNGIIFIRGSNRRIDGWSVMRQYLNWDEYALPKIMFFNTCLNSIKTIPTLIHDEKRLEDLDTMGEDHIADCCRYLLMSLHGRKTPLTPLTELEKKLAQIKIEKEKFNINKFYYG